ncbi:MAG TPA: glucokinase [Rhodanobacteraceae bacterium]|nr:glucokinase [Rhodanobacteraceae bacterium]
MAGQPAMPVRDIADKPLLAADIGGTHARLGLVRGMHSGHQMSVLAYHKYICAEHASLEAIVRDFLDHHASEPVTRGALACAGYEIDGVVINDNLPWKVSIEGLRQSLQLDDLALINDFEAVAYATQYLDPTSAMLLSHTDQAARKGPQVVVGPGTGLGSAVLLSGDPQPTVLATEAGQIALAPGNALEMDILRVLASTNEHVSCEHALSGPGLTNLYRALCTLEGATPAQDSPEAITHAANAGDDPLARKALEVFCAMLGSFAGDLAMLYGASGGVWLAGGILPKIRDFLACSTFVERFLDKGRMRAFLERVPVRLMEHGQLGVIGAAGWYLDHEGSISNAPGKKAAVPGVKSDDRQ